MLLRSRSLLAFTMIELIATLMIVAVLTSMTLFGIRELQSSGRDNQRQAKLAEIKAAVDNYYRLNGKYPGLNTNFRWSNNQTLIVGNRTITVSGALSRSSTNVSNLNGSYYYYNIDANGYRLCVRQESGRWYELSTSSSSCAGL